MLEDLNIELPMEILRSFIHQSVILPYKLPTYILSTWQIHYHDSKIISSDEETIWVTFKH